MRHPYPRTERDLRWLAENFSAQNIRRGMPERLEALAAFCRDVQEAEKAANGEPHDHAGAHAALGEALRRMHAAGVGDTDGPHTFSPWLGPDLPDGAS